MATQTIVASTLPNATSIATKQMGGGDQLQLIGFARSTVAVTAGTAGNTVVKATAGILSRVLVTASGTNSAVFYDNATTASGTVIGVLPANAPIGVYEVAMPATNGIVLQGNAANPAVTVAFV